jgi:hypothetical protein
MGSGAGDAGGGDQRPAAGDARLRHRGRALVGWMFTLALSAYNLTRRKTLAVQAA